VHHWPVLESVWHQPSAFCGLLHTGTVLANVWHWPSQSSFAVGSIWFCSPIFSVSWTLDFFVFNIHLSRRQTGVELVLFQRVDLICSQFLTYISPGVER
jgi:hypothetical protein